MKKILFSATVAAMLATGCAKDDAVVGETGGKTITITASRASGSRVAVDDSNAILWQTEDALGVYLGDVSSNKRFSLKSGAGSTAAAFECANTTLPTAPSNVYAYYPHAAADVPAASAVPFDLTSQSYGSFGEHWLMAGIAENIGFPTETTFAMQMHNLLSALRVKITNSNATALTVTQLEIYTATAGDRTFVAAGTVDITGSDFTITPTSYTHKISLDLGEGVTVASGETQVLPIVVAPTEGLNGKKFYIKYKFAEDAEASVDTKDGKSIARNKFIDIPLTIGTVTITVPETVATVDEANAALENGATDVVISEAPTADQTLVIPHNYSDAEAAVSVKLPAIPEGVALTMSYGDATANAPKTIAVKTADNATVGNLVIDAPESTVTVDGKYTSMTATTADNTLVVANNANVESLIVKKGNVEVYGIVNAVDRTASQASKVYFYVDSVEKWNKAIACDAASRIILTGDMDIKLTEDIVTAVASEAAQIIVEDNVVVNLDLAGHCIESKNDGVSIRNYGILTIDDTVGGGAIFNSKTENCVSAYNHEAVRSSGILTVNGGRFGDPDADTENENMIHRGAALRTWKGSVTTINGGSFTAGGNQKYPWGSGTGYTYAIRNDGEMTFYDATLYGTMNGGIACDSNSTALNINGGNFTVSGVNSFYVIVSNISTSHPLIKVSISGGTFTSLNSKYGGLLGGFSGMPSWDASDNLEKYGYYITGGTFIKDGETVTF